MGLHDFEQTYRDILKKCYMHGHKHQHHIAKLLNHWADWKKDDFDFQVATWGVGAALLYPRSSMSNARDVPNSLYEDLMSQHQNKPPLVTGPELDQWVRSTISRALERERQHNSPTARIRHRLCGTLGNGSR